MSIVYRGLLQVWKTKSTFWENSRICLLCNHSYLIRHQFMLFFDLLRKWWNATWWIKLHHLMPYDAITNKNLVNFVDVRYVLACTCEGYLDSLKLFVCPRSRPSKLTQREPRKMFLCCFVRIRNEHFRTIDISWRTDAPLTSPLQSFFAVQFCFRCTFLIKLRSSLKVTRFSWTSHNSLLHIATNEIA